MIQAVEEGLIESHILGVFAFGDIGARVRKKLGGTGGLEQRIIQQIRFAGPGFGHG